MGGRSGARTDGNAGVLRRRHLHWAWPTHRRRSVPALGARGSPALRSACQPLGAGTGGAGPDGVQLQPGGYLTATDHRTRPATGDLRGTGVHRRGSDAGQRARSRLPGTVESGVNQRRRRRSSGRRWLPQPACPAGVQLAARRADAGLLYPGHHLRRANRLYPGHVGYGVLS
ncbi:hypothetical protein D3C75_930150 [compost metagenome]